MNPVVAVAVVKGVHELGKSFGWWGDDEQEEAYKAQVESTTQALQAQKDMQTQSIQAQSEWVNKALAADAENRVQQIAALKENAAKAEAAQKISQNQSLAVGLSGSQLSSDLARWQEIQNQSRILPYQVAQLSSLQALPLLQQYIGMPASNIPTSFDISNPPKIDLYSLYARNIDRLNQLQPTSEPISLNANRIAQSAANTSTPNMPMTAGGNVPVLLPTPEQRGQTITPSTSSGRIPDPLPARNIMPSARIEPQSEQLNQPESLLATPDSVSASSPNNVSIMPDEILPPGYQEQPAQTYQLSPYVGASFDYKQSPMYQQQLSEGEANINRALAARGLSSGATGSMTLADFYRKLNADEAEKSYNRLMDQVRLAFGQQVTPSNYSANNAGSNLANLSQGFSNQGNALSSLYSGLGNNIAQSYANTNPSQAFSSMGTSLGQSYAGMGNAMGQNILAQGQNKASYALSQPDKFSDAFTVLENLSGLYSGGTFGSGSTNPFITSYVPDFSLANTGYTGNRYIS